MTEPHDAPVMITSADEDPSELQAAAERIGVQIRWVIVPQEVLDQILGFLRNPESGVRRGRPQRKEETNA